MPDHRSPSSGGPLRRPQVIAAAAIVAFATLVTAAVIGTNGSSGSGSAGGTDVSSSGRTSSRVPPSDPADGQSLQVPVDPSETAASAARPVLLDVPRVGIRSSLVRLGLDAKGRLKAPEDFDRAGWFAAGTVPGDVGPAVIAGHVDSTSGPAVFFRLRAMRVGDKIRVRDAAGHVRAFTVDSVKRYPKKAFPTDAVYGPTAAPVLRLITCTGKFDRRDRNYLDNLVVSASLDVPRAARHPTAPGSRGSVRRP